MAQLDLEELNKVQRYTQWAVFRTAPGALGGERGEAAAQVQGLLDRLADAGKVTVRGVYLASGFKAEADFIIWWHAEEFSDLQAALNAFRRETTLGQVSELVWCGNGLHRPSEFNKAHLPSFIMGEAAERWMTVYPFVRSYDWYVLDPADRRRILAEHGRAAASFKDVRANTTAAFALGDYEWMLAFEAGSMDRIVDLMHKMRYTEARLHVREEVPFYSGLRVDTAAELLEGLA
ncbi:hydrogen peroxide-dependent heme synthase [Corynebacterium mastitidis]|uniref:Coproheme decarboxylase n=1 Tax=Corynebacterium mastitidis TaxID=161890 RepID=A0ABU8P086_9CORY